MATILEFRRNEADTVRKEPSAPETLGEIVIFPGVRIERHAPAEGPSRPTVRRRSPRPRKKSRA